MSVRFDYNTKSSLTQSFSHHKPEKFRFFFFNLGKVCREGDRSKLMTFINVQAQFVKSTILPFSSEFPSLVQWQVILRHDGQVWRKAASLIGRFNAYLWNNQSLSFCSDLVRVINLILWWWKIENITMFLLHISTYFLRHWSICIYIL